MTSKRPTTAFVPAAGLGMRMRPLTDTLPKPLVKLAAKPLIDHVLDRLAGAGITRAVVNVHHHADLLEAHLTKRKSPKIIISDERDELLETGGGVRNALPLLGPAPFLIHNSDSVWMEGVGSNLLRLMDAWDAGTMDGLMLLTTASTSIGYEGTGDFHMDANGLLARRAEGRVAPFVFTGVSIAHPRMLKGEPAGRFSLNRVWNKAIANGRLYGVRLDGLWMHIGTPAALTAAEERLKRDALSG